MKKLAKQVVNELSLGDIQDISPVNGGYSGSGIFRVKTDTHNLIVKFPSIREEQDSPGERIYGTDAQNFVPAYDLLKTHNLPIPHLYGHGNIDGHDYAVMDFTEGVSVREHLAYNDVEPLSVLHGKVGTVFGKLHSITRSHFGNVEFKHNDSFVDVFAQAFEAKLKESEKLLDKDIRRSIWKCVENKLKDLDEPETFVFSHLDGFQGIAAEKDGEWGDVIIIDIEDHQFTDQRFVLTGHELALEIANKQTSEAFWDAYKQEVAVPENYFETKTVFQLFYLTAWMHLGIPEVGRKIIQGGIEKVLAGGK